MTACAADVVNKVSTFRVVIWPRAHADLGFFAVVAVCTLAAGEGECLQPRMTAVRRTTIITRDDKCASRCGEDRSGCWRALCAHDRLQRRHHRP